MNPDEQLKVLAKIWGKERNGYVFLPWIPREYASSADKKERREAWHESRAFKWPKDKEAIRAHLEEHRKDDLFFTPHRFLGRKRVVENVCDEVILFADLDDFPGRDDIATPEDIPRDLRPSVCWETSTGSYQGVWLFGQSARTGVYEEGFENQALTYHLGGDKGGWHGSKVLRVPGSFNNKHDKQERGKVLWWAGDDARVYSWDEMDDNLPKLNRQTLEEASVTQEMLDAINEREVLSRLRFRLDKRTRRLLRQTDDPDKGERSEVMWSIAQELSDAGANFLEIMAVVQSSVWNKHRDEPSELIRLVSLAQKVQAETKRRIESGELTEVAQEPAMDDGTLEPIGAVMSRRVKQPQWLVGGLWTTNACGWVAGAPKSYKSWLTMHLAACVAAGVPFMDRKVKQRRVLVIQMEDDESTVVDRMGRVLDGALPEAHPHGQVILDEDGDVVWEPNTRELPLFYKIQVPFVSSEDAWQDWLDEIVEQNNIGLVMIDTMFASMGTIDISDSQAVQSLILNPLKRMAKERDCAVMIVHHSTKSGDGSRGAQLLGSQALRGWADAGIYFGERLDEYSQVPVAVENKFGASTSYHVNVGSLDADRAPEERNDDSSWETSDAEHKVRSLWAPYECQAPTETDDWQEPRRSTATREGGAKKKGTGIIPGEAVAKQIANVGAVDEESAMSFHALVQAELTNGAGNVYRPGKLTDQIANGLESNLLAEYRGPKGLWKNPRFYATI